MSQNGQICGLQTRVQPSPSQRSRHRPSCLLQQPRTASVLGGDAVPVAQKHSSPSQGQPTDSDNDSGALVVTLCISAATNFINITSTGQCFYPQIWDRRVGRDFPATRSQRGLQPAPASDPNVRHAPRNGSGESLSAAPRVQQQQCVYRPRQGPLEHLCVETATNTVRPCLGLTEISSNKVGKCGA